MIDVYLKIGEIIKDRHIQYISMSNEALIKLYFHIGKILFENKITNIELKYLEAFLKGEYGVTINFSRRNLKYMQQFYSLHLKENNILSKIDWKNHIVILKHNLNNKDAFYYIEESIRHNMNYEELKYFINFDKLIKTNYSVDISKNLFTEFTNIQVKA